MSEESSWWPTLALLFAAATIALAYVVGGGYAAIGWAAMALAAGMTGALYAWAEGARGDSDG